MRGQMNDLRNRQQPRTEQKGVGASGPLSDALNRRAPVQAQMELGEKLNKTGLPDDVKSGVETLSGTSLDDVRVHYNSDAPAQLNAAAYTQSTDIHVAPGQEKHVAHEAWHVVQQKEGRVAPTMQMHGVDVNDNDALEHEADVMGERAKQTAQRMSLDDEEEEPAQMMGFDDEEEEPAQMMGLEDEEEEPAQMMGLEDEEEEPAQMMGLDEDEETAQMKGVLQARWLRG